jgi:hypothetical protein
MDEVIKFLLENKESLGKKRLNSLERWFFLKDDLPYQIAALVQPGHVGLYLMEMPDGSWSISA